MHNIIYKSESIIPWDTQSAFKMTSYNTHKEENMVFCYLKAYVHKSDLVLCSYCFTENVSDYANMRLYLNLNPEKSTDFLTIDYGFGGIATACFNGKSCKEKLVFNSFKTDDEQGYYWCGEITIPHRFIKETSGALPEEKSLITMNMTQTFTDGDLAVLFGDRRDENYIPQENARVFVVLNY